MNLKNLETSLTRLSDQYDNVQGDITETFKVKMLPINYHGFKS